MTILSLDWDYYIDSSMAERSVLFPDGGSENIAPAIEKYIWMSRYSDSILMEEKGAYKSSNGNGILGIKPDYDEIDATIALIESTVSNRTKFTIRESHASIAPILTGMYSIGRTAEVFNIDFHHDCYGISDDDQIDCGNWASKLYERGAISKIYWTKRIDSDSIGLKTNITEISIEDIAGHVEQFDHIFLCRSGIWSPPHLDSEFLHFAARINDLISTDIDFGKLIKRWDETSLNTIYKNVKETKEIYASL